MWIVGGLENRMLGYCLRQETAQLKATVHIGTYTSSPTHTVSQSCIEKQFHHSKDRVTAQLQINMGCEERRAIGMILGEGGPAGDFLEILGEREHRTIPRSPTEM